MTNQDRKIKKSQDFIQSVLKNNFDQKVDEELLRAAAERLVEAMTVTPKRQAA